MLPLAVALVVWFVRSRSVPGLVALLVSFFGVGIVLSFAGGIPRVVAPLYTATLAAWLLFVYGPVLWGALAVAWWRKSRPIALGSAALALITIGVGADAFVVEPAWCEINHYTIPSDRLESPVRIVLLADIQTEDVRDYERRVLERARDSEPDLVLFAGDYVQGRTLEQSEALAGELGELLGQVGIDAPLGVYAVAGDMEHYSWDRIFEHTTAVRITESTTFDTGPLAVTGLSLLDSRSPAPPIPQRDRFHVVVGHAPDFALADPPADLLLAGHVHGGQVRLPGIGPLVTFSQVPRAWAVGLTELPAGNHLLVSRGIGTEEQDAPRLRFLCRPELVIIDVVPR